MCERKSTGSVLNLANLITFEHRFDERAGAQRSHVCNVAEHDSESSWRVSHPVLLLHSLTLANPHCLPRALVQTYEDIIKIIKSLPSVKDVNEAQHQVVYPQGLPFKDATFATMVMTAVEAAVGEARAKLFSPHSWRVWLATALRMCNASDARIQAMGRWLNPESIKIYARMTKGEYSEWVDKLMAVKRIDTARTTNMPIMDAADAIAAWGSQLHEPVTGRLELWNDDPVAARAGGQVGPALKRHARISVYWTEMDQWFNGTCKCSRIEDADGGGKQRASCVVYDASGPWAGCKASQLTYWHCLDDEQWQALAE